MSIFDALFGAASSDATHPFWYGGFGLPTRSGITVSEDTAMTYSAAYAATVLLSSAGASLPLNLYRKEGKNRDVQTDHPLNDLVHNQPNDHTFSSAFRMLGISHQINWSPGFCAEIERNELGEVVNLWPIHPSRVAYDITQENRLVYRVTTREMASVEFDPEEVLHIPGRYMRDEVGSIGVVAHARESIGLGLATERHGASSFRNGARPTVAIKMNGARLKPEERENLRQDFMSINSGVENAGRPVMLSDNMELQQFSFSNEDAQFLQSRQHNVEEVARWYGVPPHLIGHLLRSTFNNIETQSIEFVVYSLMPWLTQWEGAMNRKLLTPQQRAEGYYFKFNVNGLLRGDNKSRSEFYRGLAQIGVFSVNEIRELEEMNPVDGGDNHYVQLNMRDITSEEEPKERAPTPPPQPQQSADQDTARLALSFSLSYLTETEVASAIAASRDDKKFMDWVEGFYGRHTGECRKVLAKASAACAKAGIAIPVDYAETRCKAHAEQLINVISTAQPAEFQGHVKATVYGWRDSIEQEVNDVTQG